MLTVYILASREDVRIIEKFWKHAALMRRQVRGISWISPLYVEDMPQSNALVETLPKPYVVVGCMSNTFVSELLDQPALREIIEGAMRQIPFLISRCAWREAPCPFAEKNPLWHQEVASVVNRDNALYEAVKRLRSSLEEML